MRRASGYERGLHGRRWTLFRGDALAAYGGWPAPKVIVSDGAYGVGGFPGDPRAPDELGEWYESHVEAWSPYAHPATTLWFWNTEVGWATVHAIQSLGRVVDILGRAE